MVNQEKLKIMIDLARIDRKEGHRNRMVNSYFKLDYLSRGLLKSFFSFTLCYVMFFIIAVLYHFDEFVMNPNIFEVIVEFKPHIFYYAFGLVIYELITIIVENHRYNYAKSFQKMETVKLRRLEGIYKSETEDAQ